MKIETANRFLLAIFLSIFPVLIFKFGEEIKPANILLWIGNGFFQGLFFEMWITDKFLKELYEKNKPK